VPLLKPSLPHYRPQNEKNDCEKLASVRHNAKHNNKRNNQERLDRRMFKSSGHFL
jgi:hypothetical protein